MPNPVINQVSSKQSYNQIWLWLCLLVFLMILLVGFSADAQASKKQIDEENTSAMLDYEILLLRAEIAFKAEDLANFNQYMLQLDKFYPPNSFVTRADVLQVLWQQMDFSKLLSKLTTDSSGFSKAKDAKTIVVLLPQSGDFGEIGQQMLEVIEPAFINRQVYVIDSSLYEDMNELWGLVKMFEPELIVGPLTKDKAQKIANLNQTIPMITFASIDKDDVSKSNILSMASINQTYLRKLDQLLGNLDFSSLVWLHDESKTAQELIQQIQQNRADKVALDLEKIQLGVDRTLAKLMGSQASKERKNWLAKSIGASLEFNSRTRKDKQLIVALTSASQAIQIAPMMDYYQLKLPVLWVPTELPPVEVFAKNLHEWQTTYSFLPAYLTYQLQDKSLENNLENKVGLFHALADLALDLISYSDQVKPININHGLGEIYIDEDNNYYLEAGIYQLGQGGLQQVDNFLP